MDLSKLWRRCSICRYKTVEDFKCDLELVASNCRLYCQEKFPSLPPAAEASVKVNTPRVLECHGSCIRCNVMAAVFGAKSYAPFLTI